MHTKISVSVDDHPCFLTFSYYDPKITNFLQTLFNQNDKRPQSHTMPCIHHGDTDFGRHFEFQNERCYSITCDHGLVLHMADDFFATDYKRYKINSVNKVYTCLFIYFQKRLPYFLVRMHLTINQWKTRQPVCFIFTHFHSIINEEKHEKYLYN